jgi:hypothetical protein
MVGTPCAGTSMQTKLIVVPYLRITCLGQQLPKLAPPATGGKKFLGAISAPQKPKPSGRHCCATSRADGASAQWCHVADQMRPKVPKLAAFLDEAEADLLAYMTSHPTALSAIDNFINPNEQWKCLQHRPADLVRRVTFAKRLLGSLRYFATSAHGHLVIGALPHIERGRSSDSSLECRFRRHAHR